MRTDKPRVLIVFNAGATVYGLERGVIETFDLLRPEIEPHFLMSYTTKRLDLPILREIKERGLSHSFLSDWTDWPRIGRPKSIREARAMSLAMIRGNRDVLKAARGMDVIYLPGINYFYFALLAALIHRVCGKRIIYHFHDLVTTPSSRLRFASLFATDFVHNTRYGRGVVEKSNPFIGGKKNWIIPYPIMRGETSALSDDAADFNGKGRHILFVGQVAKHKGVDLLLDAMALVAKDANDLTLHIVGGCNDPDLQLRISKASNNRHERVRYWGYRDDVLRMMKSADVYVHPSPPSLFQESFGRGVLEAMSVGTPTVCFKSGALQELMIDEETGITCNEESAECLATSILRMIGNRALLERCSGLSLKHYNEDYSNPRVKSLWLTLFERAK